jgi:septum formation protein
MEKAKWRIDNTPCKSYVPTIILASASPRRAELLRAAGINFTIRVADVDESLWLDETPQAYVARLAQTKALAVAQLDEIVLGADTTVVIGHEIAGKPINIDDAKCMLRMLSGQWHEVLTGVSLVRNREITTEVAVTRVKFAMMSEAEIEWYTTSGEPDDKAGAYAIQGLASRFIERIEGSYSNVVGLPLETVYRMLK